jgi:hypothetical protein
MNPNSAPCLQSKLTSTIDSGNPKQLLEEEKKRDLKTRPVQGNVYQPKDISNSENPLKCKDDAFMLCLPLKNQNSFS